MATHKHPLLLRRGLGLVALSALCLAAAPAEARVFAADAAKKKGLKLEKSFSADFDGDGGSDSLGVCSGKKGLALCVFGDNDKGAYVKHVLPAAGGRRLAGIRAEDLVPELAGDEVILEVYDETPDEKVKRVRVYTGHPTPREIFKSVIYRPKNKSKRAEWEQPGVVKYGDARPGWYFADTDNDGKKEAMVRRRAQLIPAKAGGETKKLLVGVYEAVYEYIGDVRTGEYRQRSGESFKDFLNPGHNITGVKASSTWVRPDILNELKSEALAAAVYDDGNKAKTKADGDVDIDLREFTAKVADKSLDTAWVEDANGSGKGEWVELELEEDAPIHMVRIVPGCLETKSEFRRHNVPFKMELRFDDGMRAFVDLARARDPDPPIVAMTAMKVRDKPFAKQWLVFFDGKTSASKVRLTIDGARKQGSKNRTCISEISVH
jgi:hypothetical protein